MQKLMVHGCTATTLNSPWCKWFQISWFGNHGTYPLNGSIANIREWIRNMGKFRESTQTLESRAHPQSTCFEQLLRRLFSRHRAVNFHSWSCMSGHKKPRVYMNQSIQSINIFWSWWFSVSSWPMVVVNSSRSLRTIDFLALNQGIAHSSAQFTWVVTWQRLKEVTCEMNITVQKLLAHWCVVQTFLKHSITNTLPLKKRKNEYKTFARVAPESFPFFFPPAVLAFESKRVCFGDIQWFASRVSTKPSQQEPIATHWQGLFVACCCPCSRTVTPKNVSIRRTSGSPASIHDVRIKWFEIHCCNRLAIGKCGEVNW